MFFTVLWRGVCQVLGWFFGLFGYKRDGRFAKCVWGLFATSAAVFMAVLSFVFVYSAYEFLRDNPRISTWRNRGNRTLPMSMPNMVSVSMVRHMVKDMSTTVVPARSC